MKILKNTTGSNITLLDLGITILTSSQVTLSPTDYADAADSDELVELIGNGNIVVNNGSVDLGKSDGVRLIQGGFTNKVQVDDDLTDSDRIKVLVNYDPTTVDHNSIQNNGTNTHTQIDSHIADSSIHFTEGSIDHGSISGLGDDDHPQYLNETRHDSLPSDNPHNVTASQTGAETSAQLDARDTDNRNRANHTGTQNASTISDFDVEVSNNPTVVTNTAKVSADGSINTHSDVDLTINVNMLQDVLVKLSDGNVRSMTLATLTSLMIPPVISGKVINGQIISVSDYPPGTSTASMHQWYSDGIAISGANSATYQVTDATEGSEITVKVNNGEFSNTLTNFIPLDISGLVHWIDPADAISSLTTIVNKGSGANLSRTFGIGVSTTANGLNALYMDGQQYTAADAFGGSITAMTAISLHTEEVRGPNIIYSLNGTQDGGASGTATNRIFWNAPWSNGFYYQDMGALPGARVEIGIGAFVAGRNFLTSLEYDTSRQAMFLPLSNQQTIEVKSTVAPVSTSGINIGQLPIASPGRYIFKEFIAYDSVLSTADRQKVEGYIAHKWGLEGELDASHPYSSEAP